MPLSGIYKVDRYRFPLKTCGNDNGPIFRGYLIYIIMALLIIYTFCIFAEKKL